MTLGMIIPSPQPAITSALPIRKPTVLPPSLPIQRILPSLQILNIQPVRSIPQQHHNSRLRLSSHAQVRSLRQLVARQPTKRPRPEPTSTRRNMNANTAFNTTATKHSPPLVMPLVTPRSMTRSRASRVRTLAVQRSSPDPII